MFASNDAFSELSNNQSTIGFEIQHKNVDIYTIYVTTQEAFLRSASSKKALLLKCMFNEVKEHPYMRMSFDIAWKYNMGKCANYLHTLDVPDFISDLELTDNNRTLDILEADDTIISNLIWFRYLNNPDMQIGIFLTLLIMGGDNVLRRVLWHMRTAYKYMKVSNAATAFNFPSEKFLYEEYIEEMDESDPDVQLILRRRKEWNDSMVMYKKKVDKSIGVVAQAKQKVNNVLKGQKTSKKDNKSTTEKGYKGKDKPEIDFIQLMPISIVLHIFSYLGAKDFKNVRRVNKYWDFAVTHLTKDTKARKRFNSWITAMEVEIGPCHTSPAILFKPQRRFLRSDIALRRGACDLKLHQSLRSCKDKYPTLDTSLLRKIATNDRLSFCMPANNLECFNRAIIVKPDAPSLSVFLHHRSPCIRYDDKKIVLPPIDDIPVVGEAFDECHIGNLEDTSFCYQSSDYVNNNCPTAESNSNNSTKNVNSRIAFNGNRDIDRLLSHKMAKSIATVAESKSQGM